MTTTFPTSFPQFARQFASEDACWDFLVKTRWPDGFVCPKCGAGQRAFLASRRLFRCANRHQISVTAGTSLHRTKMSTIVPTRAFPDFWSPHLPLDRDVASDPPQRRLGSPPATVAAVTPPVSLKSGMVVRSSLVVRPGVYRLADSGRMPRPLKLGSLVRWRAGEVRQWIADGKAGEMSFLADRIEQRLDPTILLPNARTVVCVAMNYHANQAGEVATPGDVRIARYARADDYHELIKPKLYAIADYVRDASPGCETRCGVDTAPISERELAARAGVGWVGKNTCVINERVGSWIFLGCVLTTLDLPFDTPAPDRCGTCTRCIDACPTHVLKLAAGIVQVDYAEAECTFCGACVDICPMDCITFTEDGEEAEVRARLSAPARNPSQDLYVGAGLKTGRIMAKDEDVCLHCGLCAERCPTGAWDMQKFLLITTKAGPSCRDGTPAQQRIGVPA